MRWDDMDALGHMNNGEPLKVWIDLADGKSRPLSDWLRHQLQQ
jgi:acyl-CoA thioesterase FadM